MQSSIACRRKQRAKETLVPSAGLGEATGVIV
jgi:hypothetical protein